MTIKNLFVCLALLGLSACASTPPAQLSDPVNDPYEKTNRAIFEFNTAVDKAAIRPVSSAYRAVVPKPARQGVSNIMRNLREPWVLVNDILQGKLDRAGNTLGRFLVNSTIGIAGLFKVSDSMGIPYHSEDFGQTLASWGIGQGKYMVIPFLGPSSGRDFAGFGVGFFADPTDIAIDKLDEKGAQLARLSVDVLDRRSRLHTTLDSLYEEKDPYLVARSAYLQLRAFEIRDGAKEEVDEEDLFGDLEDCDTGDGEADDSCGEEE